MLTTQVALIDNTGVVDPGELAAVAAAISIQVTRDLSQFWPVSATVQVLPANTGVPPGFLPVFLVGNLPQGEGGVHLAVNNQPYANVQVGNGWTVAASHEVCEMLVDPSTNKTYAATAIAVDNAGNVLDIDGTFEYLVEVCDPSESPDFAYSINGVVVSDFYTPNYFDSQAAAGVRYSFTQALKAPRRVLAGGYLTWHDPVMGVWNQLNWVDTSAAKIIPVSGMAGARSFREQVDAQTQTTKGISLDIPPKRKDLYSRAAKHRENLKQAALARRAVFGH